ncbi:hypothetical protein [Rubinisphaera brasiliensis]|uniref:UDP-N-acetylglucosamine kinase n=1 Tax=Rubinisphaera brasiliensis (strain ATCC 49424 / DSM 5305 / JCM 21570 / IAM 15109 / NBRC 103401 / IFAM 1448) TaxID=756272 RepID=F0SJ83_RUBBR|nr:hypothetical protein [Rubinisphaera brasiliensis]ADY58625.1 hypothetical protein Plabr_1004 [Rubinisphaera brasiliensis DSM 5305]
MTDDVPRVRMFAGPNGSGKSTLNTVLPSKLIGQYLNADELEQQMRTEGYLNFSDFGVSPTQDELLHVFDNASLLGSQRDELQRFSLAENLFTIPLDAINSYVAATLAGYLRREFLRRTISFTFETVMSHPSKVDFLATAQEQGFRTYLYYVATEDPLINIARVRNRVATGGHDVPEDKIKNRYFRSLDLLYSAIRNSHRAYIFDNSGKTGPENRTWLAEITDGTDLELKTNRIPAWFEKYVLNKAGNSR